MKPKYDFLLVGAGLFNAIFAKEATKVGKTCLVIEKRNHIGGNLYCEETEGITKHKYGPHIFHTNSKFIWDYMNEICTFNPFVYSPLAKYKNELYNLPFNMNTFYQLWKTKTPYEAKAMINKQKEGYRDEGNLETFALSQVGDDIYYKLIKEYTEKQWGCSAAKLPSFIIKRIPLRFSFDNNYFNDKYQGIPDGGYNRIFDVCFSGCDVLLNTDFLQNQELKGYANQIIYTGMIDEYYDYCYGTLQYRSLRFEEEILNTNNYQGNVAINYTEKEIPFTRIIEHNFFNPKEIEKTVITKEYPQVWKKGEEAYYPVNTEENNAKYKMYEFLSSKEPKIIFSGRLGSYQYYDMWQIVDKALQLFKEIEINN